MMDSPYGPAAWTLLLCWALLPLPSMAHLPKSYQSQHALLICPTRGQGAREVTYPLVPTSKAVYNGQVVLVELFAVESSKRKKQNINSKRFLSVGEKAFLYGVDITETHQSIVRTLAMGSESGGGFNSLLLKPPWLLCFLGVDSVFKIIIISKKKPPQQFHVQVPIFY